MTPREYEAIFGAYVALRAQQQMEGALFGEHADEQMAQIVEDARAVADKAKECERFASRLRR